jgi:hypothetical protein
MAQYSHESILIVRQLLCNSIVRKCVALILLYVDINITCLTTLLSLDPSYYHEYFIVKYEPDKYIHSGGTFNLHILLRA